MTNQPLEDKYKIREECRGKWVDAYSECPINPRKFVEATESLKKINIEIGEIEDNRANLNREIQMLIDRCRERERIKNAEIEKAKEKDEIHKKIH